MAEPAFSINFTAQMAAALACNVGNVLLYDSTSGSWKVATAALRASLGKRAEAVALTAYGGSVVGQVSYQSAGVLATEISGLAAGAASWVRCSATGTIERCTPTTGDDIIGYAEADGRVHLAFGTWTAANVNGGASTAGACTLEQFGAVGDGVADDSAALTAALNALAAGTYRTLRLGAKTYLVPTGGAVPGSCSIIGQGHASVLKTNVGAPVLTIGAVNDIVLQNFKVLGNAAVNGNAHGIKMGVAGVANSGPQRVTLINILVDSMWASGFYYSNSPLTLHEGPKFIGCHARNGNNYGFRFEQAGEYASLSSCEAAGNGYGIYIAAGNIACSSCIFTDNTYGAYLDAGANDAHGTFSGCFFNHNATANVFAGAIVNGHTFDGCHIYGGNIQLVSSLGVSFTGCKLSVANYTFDGSLGTTFQGCRLIITPSTVVDNANAHPSQTRWLPDCVDLNGNVPDFVAIRVQPPFTFAADANQTLTLQQSEADTVIIAAGVITVARTLTINSTPAASKSRRRRFVNNNAQTVNVAFTTGTAFALAAGAKAWIGSDGTNAIEV